MTFGGVPRFPPFHLYKIFILESILLSSCANIALPRTFFGLPVRVTERISIAHANFPKFGIASMVSMQNSGA